MRPPKERCGFDMDCTRLVRTNAHTRALTWKLDTDYCETGQSFGQRGSVRCSPRTPLPPCFSANRVPSLSPTPPRLKTLLTPLSLSDSRERWPYPPLPFHEAHNEQESPLSTKLNYLKPLSDGITFIFYFTLYWPLSVVLWIFMRKATLISWLSKFKIFLFYWNCVWLQ